MLGRPGIDGKFGPYTEGGVKQFQIDNGLKGKDGVAGPETWGAICKLLSSASPTSMLKETKDFYHQIAFEQETPSKTPLDNMSETELFQKYSVPAEEEIENDLPFYLGLINLTKAEIVAIQAEPPPVKNMTEALPPSENMTEALPPSENMTEALPPSENMTEALPPSENMTEALPPSENMTEALPPSENMTEALPPSENMTEALPPSENMTEALPPSENMTEALPQEELLPG